MNRFEELLSAEPVKSKSVKKDVKRTKLTKEEKCKEQLVFEIQLITELKIKHKIHLSELANYLIDEHKELLISTIIKKALDGEQSKDVTSLITYLQMKKWSIFKICTLFNKSPNWFYRRQHDSRYLKSKKVKVKKEHDIMKRIKDLRDEGKTIAAIAQILEKSMSYVYQRLNSRYHTKTLTDFEGGTE